MHFEFVKMTTTTTGPGTLDLVQVTGFPTLGDSPIAVGQAVAYTIRDDAGRPIESGIGTKLASNQLSRDRIKATYVSGTLDASSPTAATLAAGTKTVLITPISSSILPATQTVDSVSTGHYRYIESRHLTQSEISNTYTFTANRCVYVPFYCEHQADVDAAIVNVITASAGKLRIALKAMTPNMYPGATIAETGDIDTSTTGIKTAAFGAAATVVPGWYCLAYLSDAAPVIRAYAASNNTYLTKSSPFGYNTALQAIIGRYEAVTAGWTAVPATPSNTTTAMTINAVFAPHALLRLM